MGYQVVCCLDSERSTYINPGSNKHGTERSPLDSFHFLYIHSFIHLRSVALVAAAFNCFHFCFFLVLAGRRSLPLHIYSLLRHHGDSLYGPRNVRGQGTLKDVLIYYFKDCAKLDACIKIGGLGNLAALLVAAPMHACMSCEKAVIMPGFLEEFLKTDCLNATILDEVLSYLLFVVVAYITGHSMAHTVLLSLLGLFIYLCRLPIVNNAT